MGYPTSEPAQKVVNDQQTAAIEAPAVADQELGAQEFFERGYHDSDRDEQIRLFSVAIRLKPNFAWAFANRAWVRTANGDLLGAMADYAEAARLGVTDFFEPQR
jgi:hypothetical protein